MIQKISDPNESGRKKGRSKSEPWPPALVFNLCLFWGGLVSLGTLAFILGPSYWLSVPSTVVAIALIPGVKNAWKAVP